MDVGAELDRIAAYLVPGAMPPNNETETREKVITPLLLAMGYGYEDLAMEANERVGSPDYWVLPDSPHVWVLEAKAWGVPLNIDHAAQACKYAHDRSCRWAVVSNGREWRLYDDEVRGGYEDRLVIGAALPDTDGLTAIVRALSRESVVSGAIEGFSIAARVEAALGVQFTDPRSPAVDRMARLLKDLPGLADVRAPDIVAAWQRLTNRPTREPGPLAEPTGAIDESPRPGGNRITSSLGALALADPRGSRPSELVLPDGQVRTVQYWREVAMETIEWLIAKDRLVPLPFRGLSGGSRYFANATPTQPDGKDMRSPGKARYRDGTVYIDLSRSAWDLTKCLLGWLVEVGLDASALQVTYSRSPAP